MSAAPACPTCGGEVFLADGACAACWLRPALEDEPSAAEPPGTRFGDYELEGVVARGGMGIVYRARDTRLGRTVALKMLLLGGAADRGEQQRFDEEIRNVKDLEHPNIVPLYEAGAVDGTRYFTMPLLTGGSLEARMAALQADRRQACALLATVARAAHFAHQRNIVHRDLKPSNILFEGEVARVADFGTAKNLAASRAPTATGTMIGTPGYMAPEQVRGGGARVTAAADVYGIGAMLYEVLTGRPPFTAETWERTLQQVAGDAEPVRPRQVDPGIHPDLETICLGCLEKDPARRYPSAQALAEDLTRYLELRPIALKPPGRLGRALRWCRRNPAVASLAAAALLFATLAAASALSVGREQAAALRARVLAAESHTARMAAGSVQLQLREDADLVRLLGEDRSIVQLLERGDCKTSVDAGVPSTLREGPAAQRFDSWLVDDAQSREIAHWPPTRPPFDVLCRTYDFRDYFQGAVALGAAGRREVHVSRAFRTEADGRMKFFFSTPVFGPDGGMLGITGASVPSGSLLGKASISGDAIVGALLSPRDRSREERDAGLPADFVYLVHDDVPLGEQALRPGLSAFRADDKRGLRDVYRLESRCWTERGIPSPDCVVTDADFRDDVPGYEGRWLAALAPVAGSSFVVVVQTRDDVALGPGRAVLGAIVRDGGALFLGATLLGAGLFLLLRRRR